MCGNSRKWIVVLVSSSLTEVSPVSGVFRLVGGGAVVGRTSSLGWVGGARAGNTVKAWDIPWITTVTTMTSMT